MPTVVSQGVPRAVSAKAYPFPTGTSYTSAGGPGLVPLLRGDGAVTTFDGMVKTQPMVYAAVTKLTNGVARNPLKVYEYGIDGESRQQVRGTSLNMLMRKPRPRASQFGFKSFIAQSLFTYGEALMVKVRSTPGAAPTELWEVPWRNVQVVSDESGIIGYVITVGAQSIAVGPEDVVHWTLPGGSPLAPLRRTLALEDAAIAWQGQSLAQGMTKRGAFVTDQRLNDASIPRMRADLEQLYSGVDNAGRIALLEQGLRFQEVGITPVDADLLNQRRLSREEVCAAYDLSPALLGLEHATYASVAEWRKGLYDSIATRLTLIEDTLMAQLIEPEPEWDGLFVEFDTGDLLRPDPEARARTHMMNQQAAVNTVNERRKFENLPRIDDPMADTVFVPVNMAPLGAPVTDGGSAGTPAQGLADRVLAASLTLAAGDTAPMLDGKE